MSILIPFLVFAIGVSHSVQMINTVSRKVTAGESTKSAAASAFRSLIIPGGIALLSDTVGFLTLLTIDIGIIRELAISASLGVGVIILTNLILLPLLISFTHVSVSNTGYGSSNSQVNKLWRKLSLLLPQVCDMGTDDHHGALWFRDAASEFDESWRSSRRCTSATP